MVAGSLDTVRDLRVQSDTNFISLSWSPPFSLNVTDTEPDVWYTVLVYNVTDKDNPLAVPWPSCQDIADTNCTFTAEDHSPLHEFSFAVVPKNGVGNGKISRNVTGTFQNGNYNITLEPK